MRREQPELGRGRGREPWCLGCKENPTWGWLEVGGTVRREGKSFMFPFSENNVPRTNKTEFQLELPVKYAIYMAVTRYWLLGLDLRPCPWAGRSPSCACVCV